MLGVREPSRRRRWRRSETRIPQQSNSGRDVPLDYRPERNFGLCYRPAGGLGTGRQVQTLAAPVRHTFLLRPRLGSRQRQLWRVALHLRHAGLFLDRLGVGGATFGRSRCFRHRDVPAESCVRYISFLVELLAAIPSVIYGLWGIFVLAPLLRDYVEPFLAKTLGWTGLFGGPMYGLGMLAAGIILAIMIVPVIASITREVMTAVPQNQREAVLALGATRWEMIRMGVLRNARIGIVGGVILGLGRALGETMAVTMLIGNRPEVSKSLFAPGYTMASVIANEFTEATGDMYLSALVEIGLALFIVTLIVNALARLLVWSITGGTARPSA